ncbi:hypothetical protein C8R46DRAFT_1120557 [Mycena filopes]|nr:hypothetical protein C8R46DRAFT_1120557 [Mycena filopes]
MGDEPTSPSHTRARSGRCQGPSRQGSLWQRRCTIYPSESGYGPSNRRVFGDTTHSRYVKGPLTRKEVDGDHWAVMSHAVELNETLVKWIEGLDV